MNSAKYVTDLIAELKAKGEKPQDISWKAAKACTGWAYVFGARGQECKPSYRRSAYASHGADNPTIKSACKNFDGNGSCSGCKWYPSGMRTRVFDCRGFTYWILKQVYGWELMGGGATSQWNIESNWTAKGTIDTMPKDTLCCLFYTKKGNPKVMAHTGFGLNGETIECSSGVQYSSTLNKKWTHWAVPKVVSSDVQPGEPSLPTLRKGDKGSYVKELQQKLIAKGFSCGSYGVDGDFGSATEKAVKAFQKASGLKVDGIVGASTWEALNAESKPNTRYSVTIKGLTADEAAEIANKYKQVTVVEE